MYNPIAFAFNRGADRCRGKELDVPPSSFVLGLGRKASFRAFHQAASTKIIGASDAAAALA
ncbi:MAG: hypothetical protein KKC20_18650 [Proteobacteria bacterium]|nr:hypothetical protein [Pseudomonadota bacterium]